MEDKEKQAAPVAPAVDVEALKASVDAAVRDAAAKAVEAYKASLPAVTSGLKVVADHDEERPFKTFADQLIAIKNAAKGGGQVDERLLKVLKAVPSGLNESIGADGGFLVQPDFAAEIVKKAYDRGAVLSRVRKFPVSGNQLKINGIDESSRIDGSRWGGVRGYWKAEGVQATASDPKFYQVALELKKLMLMAYITDELLADAPAMAAIVEQAFADEVLFKTENAIINGTGAGQPLGVLNAGCVVSVGKETGQAADTVVFENVLKMWSRLWAPGRSNAVWLINQDVEPQLYSMAASVGTGGNTVFLPQGGLSVAPYSTLFGRPVLAVEYCDTVGDSGDVVLADLSQYALIDKGPLGAYSIHLRFDYDEQVYRMVYRVDGAPLWKNTLTPYLSGNTLSPFVKLDARA